MTFSGSGTSLQEQVQMYIDKHQINPNTIISINITAGPKIQAVHPSVTIIIIHSIVETKQLVKSCKVVVVCNDLAVFESLGIKDAMNSNGVLLYHDSIQDASGTHYWVGIFAPLA